MDASRAVNWYRRAAAQNHARALDKLGVHLQTGIGVRQNHPLAAKYFRRAAEQGHTAAQYHLGLCYERGMGVTVNLQEALVWFERAALVCYYVKNCSMLLQKDYE